MEKATHRVIFSRQPARMVLVDFSPPFNMDTCYILQQAISHFFCLACNLAGPARAPFFSLFAIGNYPEAVLPLQPVRNNFARIQAALNELQILYNNTQGNVKKTRCLGQAIEEAVAQYKRQANNLLQSAGYWCQLELIIITCRDGSVVAKQAERVFKTMEIDSLRKVQVLVLNNPDQLMMDDGTNPSQSQTSVLSEDSSDELEGVVDIVTVENDALSLGDYFKTWLLDQGTDKEHLHLTMPKTGPDNQPLVLNCDLHERLLNPNMFSYSAQYSLQIDGDTNSRPNLAANKGNATVPVYKLRAEKLVNADSICESTIFGLPLVVKPTSCWKMDWDELEVNQQHFHALCHLLQEKNLVLLTSLEVSQQNQGAYYSKTSCSKPSGHFILMPSSSCALVLRSIAVQEIMLPCDLTPPSNGPSEQSVDLVSRSLEQLEEVESYNPLLTSSGLYECLSHVPGGKQQKRKALIQGGPKAATSIYDVPLDPSAGPQTTNQKRFRPTPGKMVYANNSFPEKL